MTRDEARAELIAATVAMAGEGAPLMRRVIPAGEAVRLWDRYPCGGLRCAASGSSAFYHVHPPGERGVDEHGHFHLFLPRSAMADPGAPLIVPQEASAPRQEVVHIAALSIDPVGLPLRWFTVNRWVTDEYLFPAAEVTASLGRFSLAEAGGDVLLGRWLTAAVALWRPAISALLDQRDTRLAAAGFAGEDRSLEILSSAPADINVAIGNLGGEL